MSKKILIVEDEKPMAHALELKLNKAGFDAKAVFDGEEALAELEVNEYDLIITDLVMPKVDGFGLLKALKEKGNTTSVIVASNLSQQEDLKKAKELGAVDFFIKSDTPLSEIVEKIQNL